MRKFILAATAAATLVAPTVAMASTGHKAPSKGVRVHACVKHPKHGLKVRLAQKCRKGEKGVWLTLAAGHDTNSGTGPQGPQGIQGSAGKNGTNGINGSNGTNGTNGRDGAQGPQGVSSPWTWSYTGGHSQDGGDSGQPWANDTYNTQFSVIPQTDGSYEVVKSITGTFVTIAGEPTPNDASGNSRQTGGVTGTMTGLETWKVTDANFDPTATPDLNRMEGNNAQNAAFTAAFFPGGTYNLSTYDFVYHTDSHGSWVDSNTHNNNTTTDIAG
jgi:hypothetical protein